MLHNTMLGHAAPSGRVALLLATVGTQCLRALSLVLQAALARLVLKRYLLLATLLDRAVALSTLPSGAPLLFRVGSKVKASTQVRNHPPPHRLGLAVHLTASCLYLSCSAQHLSSYSYTRLMYPAHVLLPQVVTELLQTRLVGEGDVLRTLGRLGYKLAYVQDPRRELSFEGGKSRRCLRPQIGSCQKLFSAVHSPPSQECGCFPPCSGQPSYRFARRPAAV